MQLQQQVVHRTFEAAVINKSKRATWPRLLYLGNNDNNGLNGNNNLNNNGRFFGIAQTKTRITNENLQ